MICAPCFRRTNTYRRRPLLLHGLALASDPDDASLTDVTIHRLCVRGRDELSMFLAAGRHIEVFRQKAEAAGKPLPITINMGLDPAIYIGACFEAYHAVRL